MAKSVVMAVWDRAQEGFGRPFFVKREAEGVRMFSSEVNTPNDQNLLFRHPDSFELWSLGEFDEEGGTFSGSPRMVISALNCVREAKNVSE